MSEFGQLQRSTEWPRRKQHKHCEKEGRFSKAQTLTKDPNIATAFLVLVMVSKVLPSGS
jgi:hypothetical protein